MVSTSQPSPLPFSILMLTRSRVRNGREGSKILAWSSAKTVLTFLPTPSGIVSATDIGIATSTDLIHWTKQGPALVGEKYQHFDYKSASIVTRLTNGRLIAAKIHGKYWMYWGEIQVRLATSPDLIHWTPVENSSGKAIVLLRTPAATLRQRVPRSWTAIAAHRSR